jgi:hypothetical protein
MRPSWGNRVSSRRGPMCWLCNGPLTNNGKIVFNEVELPNGLTIQVHKTCTEDTRRLANEQKQIFPGSGGI